MSDRSPREPSASLGPSPRGCSSMAEHQLPKLTMRVRFPSPAPAPRPQVRGAFVVSDPAPGGAVSGPCPYRAFDLRAGRLDPGGDGGGDGPLPVLGWRAGRSAPPGCWSGPSSPSAPGGWRSRPPACSRCAAGRGSAARHAGRLDGAFRHVAWKLSAEGSPLSDRRTPDRRRPPGRTRRGAPAARARSPRGWPRPGGRLPTWAGPR